MSSTILKLVDQASPRCGSCGSRDVGKAGKHLRPQTGEYVQNYKCRKCGTTFLPDVYRMGKTPKAVVDLAVELAREGMPIAQIRRELPVSRDRVTIRRWLRAHAPELSWRQQEPPVDAEVLRLSARPPTSPKVPAFGLSDVGGDRRILVDPALTERFHSLVRGKYSAYSDAYHSLYSNGRSTYARGQWAPTARFYRRLAKRLGVSDALTERHVLGVMAGKSGRAHLLSGPLPVRANGGFAFLIGLFYASGGIGERSLHFAVDRDVALYLQEELSQEVHEAPTICAKGSEKRPEHGSYKVTYGRTMLQVLRKFGLKTVDPVQLGRGKWVPSRYMALGIPNWVRREPYFLHRFVEGYANGLKLSVGLEGRLDGRKDGGFYPHVFCTAKVSFCCRDRRQLEEFSRVVAKHLASLGAAPGYLVDGRTDGRKMQHSSYSWYTMAGLRNFRDNFLIIRPMARLKLGLRLSRDPVVKHILQRTRDLDNFILGALIEGPKTEDALVAMCPRRPYNMDTIDLLRPSIDYLREMKVIRKAGVEWEYDPSEFVSELADYYRRRVRAEQVHRAKVRQDPLHTAEEIRAKCDIAAQKQLEELAPLLEAGR